MKNNTVHIFYNLQHELEKKRKHLKSNDSLYKYTHVIFEDLQIEKNVKACHG